MLKIIDQFLDLIFPPRRSELLVRKTTAKELTALFQPDSYGDIRFLALYKNPLIEALIKENKYHQNTRARRALSDLLSMWLQKQHLERMILVPIPQSLERAREREHNQVESILTDITLPKSVTIDTKLIQKSKHTKTQTSLSREARLKNVRDSFSLAPQARLSELTGATIVIVDDVVTTGATMEAARASLALHLPSDTRIILLALAH